jgi:hypothetical protein
MRQRPYKRREKGYVFDDPLLGYIKGYDRLEAASRNGMELKHCLIMFQLGEI